MSDGTGLDESEELSAAATHRATSLDDLRPSVAGSLSPGPLRLVAASEPWVLFAPQGTPHVQRQLSLLKVTGGQVHHLDSRDLMTEWDVYRAFAEALRFPQYFGRNWDALVDCLDDLCGAVTGGVGLAVVVPDADPLLDADHFPLLVSVLCQGADRANSAADLDGFPPDRPAIAEHFVFEFRDFDCEKVARRAEQPDPQPCGVALNPVPSAPSETGMGYDIFAPLWAILELGAVRDSGASGLSDVSLADFAEARREVLNPLLGMVREVGDFCGDTMETSNGRAAGAMGVR